MDLCGLCLRHRWQWLLKAADKLPANDTDSLCKILALLPLPAMPALPADFALFSISIDTRRVHDFTVTLLTFKMIFRLWIYVGFASTIAGNDC